MVRTRLKRLSVIVIASLLVVACTDNGGTGSDEGTTLKVAAYIGDDGAHGRALQWWADEIERRTDGELTLDVQYNEGLVSAVDTRDAIRDGRVDAGYMSIVYHPGEFPFSSVTELLFGGTRNVPAQMKVLAEMYEDDEQLRAEWNDQGLHVLLWNPLDPTTMFAAEPVESTDDITGNSWRAVGFGPMLVEAVGGHSVAIPVPELYEALQRGLVDGCATCLFDDAIERRLHEVAPYAIDAGLGTLTVNEVVINVDVWESLPDDVRQVVEEVNAEYLTAAPDLYSEAYGEACQNLLAEGGTPVVWEDGAVDQWASLVRDGVRDRWVDQVAEVHGEEAAQGFLDDYLSRIAQAEAAGEPFATGVQQCAEAAR